MKKAITLLMQHPILSGLFILFALGTVRNPFCLMGVLGCYIAYREFSDR